MLLGGPNSSPALPQACCGALGTSVSLLELLFSSVKWKNTWAREKAGWEEEHHVFAMDKLVKRRSGGRQVAGWGHGPGGGGEPRMPDGAREPRDGPQLAQTHPAITAFGNLRPSASQAVETKPGELSPAPPKLSLDLNLL